MDLITIKELRKTLEIAKTPKKSWRDVALELYPDEDPKELRAVLYRIAKDGYEPRNVMRKKLGLVPLKVIEACPVCGTVHLTKCPKEDIEIDVPVRAGLGLAPVCRKHGVVHCYDCESQVVKAKPKPRKSRPRPAYKQLYQKTAVLLLAVLNERNGNHAE